MPSPNPTWTPGDKITSPVQEHVTFATKDLSVEQIYKILVSSIVPRPIALVSTRSKSGQGNLAPFSSYNLVASSPPTLLFSVARHPDGRKKDTLRNIEETNQFVVNSTNSWNIEPAVFCGEEFPPEISELEKAGFTPVPSLSVSPPRIKESSVNFECETYKLVEIGEGGKGASTLVIGKILQIHVDKSAWVDGKISLEKLKPVSRLGGKSYAFVGETFQMTGIKEGKG